MLKDRNPDATRGVRRKRVLVVNCYFDDSRLPIHRTTKIPQAVGPIYLAGAFARQWCDVRCYTELASGPLEDEKLLTWPDMLVLTGLTNSFDRMLHLTAYARTKNPKVIVVAGGPPVRVLPLLARRYFDYACSGDIEELCAVIKDAFGEQFVAQNMMPRYDLAYWLGRIGYVETTRYCNFHCSFCSLTAEGRSYQTYDLNYIRSQIMAAGKRHRMFFLDNNFYGSNREHFEAKIELIREMKEAGYFNVWGALVTNDFFRREENMLLAKQAGCELLFSGLESFDNDWLRTFNKLQNTSAPQVEMVSRSLDNGVVFSYGLMVDVSNRNVADLRRELEFIIDTPEITLPSFVTLAIPILGTPYFYDCLKKHSLLPSTRLRDMDGTTILQKPLDALSEVVKFVDDVQCLRGYRARILRHSLEFFRHYHSKLTRIQMALALVNGLLISSQPLATSLKGLGWLKRRPATRTYVATTEQLDHMYTPAFRVKGSFESYFKPTMVTDSAGELHQDLLDSGLLQATMPRTKAAFG